jgi:hypothetical protein
MHVLAALFGLDWWEAYVTRAGLRPAPTRVNSGTVGDYRVWCGERNPHDPSPYSARPAPAGLLTGSPQFSRCCGG